MHRRVYTVKPLHRAAFAHRSLLRTEPFAQSSFYTAKSYTDCAETLSREVFTQRSLYAQTRLHREVFTQRSFCTQNLDESCTHRRVHTQEDRTFT